MRPAPERWLTTRRQIRWTKRASAQGLQGATLEVTAGLVAVIAGFLYDPLGPKWIFTGAAVLMLVGSLIAHLMSSGLRRDGHPIVTGDSPTLSVVTASG